jgi:lambda family phage portal protein
MTMARAEPAELTGPRGAGRTTTPAEAFESMKSDYAAAKVSRFRRTRSGLPGMGAGADFHYRSEADYLRILEYARDMDRNDIVVGQAVDRSVNNTMQSGFKLNIQINDDSEEPLEAGLEKDLYARWSAWASDPDACDLAGELTFDDAAWLAARASLVDGDIVGLGTIEGPLQLIEGHRIRTPRSTTRHVVHGVLLDDQRRRLEYWITKDDIDPQRPVPRVSDVVPYRVRDELGGRMLFHVLHPKRVTQTRGVSAFAPMFDHLGMFEDINFARLVQQQIVSCFAVFREREKTFTGGAYKKGQQTTDTWSGGASRVLEGIAPGMDILGAPGEKLSGFSPDVPNPEYFPHVKLILTLIGINLGLPLVLMLLDAGETNFSGWRGAIDQARLGFRRNQQAMVQRWHSPIYRWKLNQWIAEDSILRSAANRLGPRFFRHRWSTPKWPYIEPHKDALGDATQVDNRLSSRRRLLDERGIDIDELDSEIVADNGRLLRAAIAEAKAINTADSEAGVTWRDVLNLPAKAEATQSLGLAMGGERKPAPAPRGGGNNDTENDDDQAEA